MHWTIEDRDALSRIAVDWDICADAMDAQPVCDPIFTRCLADSFLTEADDFSLHLLWQGSRLVSAIPMMRTGALPRAWTSFDNPHHPYWLFPLDPRVPGAVEEVVRHWMEDADYACFRRLHRNGPLCQTLLRACKEQGFDALLSPQPHADAFVRLSGSFDEFRKTLSRNITSDVPRKLRKLEKLGKLDFEVVHEGPTLMQTLDECLHLETRGWKGLYGKPILTDPPSLRFYLALAKELSLHNRFALYLLRLDGRIIAFEYCVRHRGRIDMLKLSFDPDLGHLSPGNVLRWFLFQHELAEGTIRTYHLGNPRVGPLGSTWKLRWATDVEPLVALRVYNRSFVGKLAYFSGPRLRGYLKRSRAGALIQYLVEREDRREAALRARNLPTAPAGLGERTAENHPRR